MTLPTRIRLPQTEATIALLIDADNAPASKIAAILTELAKYGVATVRRAYGNWTSPNLQGWQACLHDYAIRPIQQFDYTKGKNAADMALMIDAMDLLYTQQLDAFALVSSDCDFTPLVMRLLTNGLKVYGFGEQKTPRPFVSACSRFLFLETIDQEPTTERPNVAVGVKKTGPQLKHDTTLMNLLRGAVASTQDDDGWSPLTKVGSHITNQSSFDARNYGYAKLSMLFEAIDLFEIERRNLSVYVRSKLKGSKPKT
ncbi:MAG TPA: NYN domain-containing protein [Herpetosiphonaceae bacterium]